MRWSLALAAAALLPGVAAAFDWTGTVGAEYWRTDDWAPGVPRATSPQLDLNLALEAAGFIANPGTVDYSGRFRYRWLDNSYANSASQRRDSLEYRLQSAFFADPRSPATASVFASHLEDDLSVSGTTGAQRSTTTFYGATTELRVPDRPSLQLGYTYAGHDLSVPTVGPSHQNLQTVTAQAGSGTSAFNYNARYLGNFSDGTYATDNYQDHRVDASGQVNLAPKLDARIEDTYFLRKPTTDSAFNPRQDSNAFVAMLRYTGDAIAYQQGTYTYGRASQQTPGQPDIAREQHQAAYSLQEYLGDPEWRIRGTASATYVRNVIDTTETHSSGEDLTPLLVWHRDRPAWNLELRAGPSFGVLQPATGPAQFGHGAQAGVTSIRRWDRGSGNLTYDAGYRSDLGGEQGWSVRQQLTLGADQALGLGFLRGQLTASAERRDSSTFGQGANRSVSLNAGYRWSVYDLQLQGGLQDGLAGTITGSVSGDGLFLPAPYNSHTRYLVASAFGQVSRYLGVNGSVRLSSTDLPDRPRLDESEGRAAVVLSYGSLRLSLEDRYTLTDTDAGSSRSNQIWVRLYRTFGSRF